MSTPKILLQLDADRLPSVFDSVVAIDAGVDHLLSHGGVEPLDVRELVYGAIFTRGTADLHHTAVFVGGSSVAAGEAILAEVIATFLGPLRVSVMLDAGGANTTATAAVLAATKHAELRGANALVLGATGPVGQRVVRLLASKGAIVRAASRDLGRAHAACEAVSRFVPNGVLKPIRVATAEETAAALEGTEILVASGPPGVALLSTADRAACGTIKVAIDLNAVPPVGLEGIEPADRGVRRASAFCHGAIGVGGLKMKIHKAAIRRLFESNDAVLDAAEIWELAERLDA